MKTYFLKFLSLISVLFFVSNSFANFTIMPVEIEINKDNKVATMRLQNNDYMPKRFQLILKKREYKDGVQEYVETKDLIATPGTFPLEGNKEQLIRITLSKNTKNFSRKKNDYIVEVRELPHKIRIDNGINSTINFVVQLNIPITVSS
ncbi:MAG TPA: fimbria/pilus periplasmic chaperone [Rickettsia endosymbiont of Pyrocoelia pectoralis]|nr:fimbria/pilus periplasmic chaperone [Rickettsia endosymbiont of Pyrocoelia pectoralis]